VKARNLLLLAGGAAALGWWLYVRLTSTTVLAVQIDWHFEKVVKNSTYPVLKNSTIPRAEFEGSGVVWVTKPAVIIKYDDPDNGFILPPTKFAAINFTDYRADVINTSPMLEALPFDRAAEILEQVQRQLKVAGWQPLEENNERWLDLSQQGRAELRIHGGSTELVVPKRNLSMYLNFKCFAGNCNSPDGTARYLIDLSLGKKSYSDYKGE
jgi:hypothetical protein